MAGAKVGPGIRKRKARAWKNFFLGKGWKHSFLYRRMSGERLDYTSSTLNENICKVRHLISKTVVASVDVTILYTNMTQEEGTDRICR